MYQIHMKINVHCVRNNDKDKNQFQMNRDIQRGRQRENGKHREREREGIFFLSCIHTVQYKCL